MRHTGAGLAIPDFPLAFGHSCRRTGTRRSRSTSRTGSARCSCPLLVLATAGHVFYHHRRRAELRRPSLLLLVLLAIQITLGALTVLSGKHYIINSLHVVTGAWCSRPRWC